jgi:hypothetical protein
MPRVDLHLYTRQRKASLLLVSRKDAAKVTALLHERLPANVDGRNTLWLIDDAWKHVL